MADEIEHVQLVPASARLIFAVRSVRRLIGLHLCRLTLLVENGADSIPTSQHLDGWPDPLYEQPYLPQGVMEAVHSMYESFPAFLPSRGTRPASILTLLLRSSCTTSPCQP